MLNKIFITILVLISKNAFTLECGLDWSNSEALSVSLTDKGKKILKTLKTKIKMVLELVMVTP